MLWGVQDTSILPLLLGSATAATLIGASGGVQAGLAETGKAIFVPEKVGIGQMAELSHLYDKLAEVDVIGPSTAISLHQLTRAIGAPMLRCIERLPDSAGSAK